MLTLRIPEFTDSFQVNFTILKMVCIDLSPFF